MFHRASDSCYTTIVSGQPCNLYVMANTTQPTAFPYIWPLPQQFTNGSVNVTVNAEGFYFITNVTSIDLDRAISRFNSTLFPHPSQPTGPSTISGVFINVCCRRNTPPHD